MPAYDSGLDCPPSGVSTMWCSANCDVGTGLQTCPVCLWQRRSPSAKQTPVARTDRRRRYSTGAPSIANSCRFIPSPPPNPVKLPSLPTITPNVSLHPQQQGNPLGDYIASLERLEGLDVKTVLPAHEYTFEDLHGRLRSIEQHHEERLGEMVAVIGDQPRTAYEVAKGVKWATGSFDTFSSWMQRAAIGETLSHVEYLVIEGRLEKFMENGVQYYRKSA